MSACVLWWRVLNLTPSSGSLRSVDQIMNDQWKPSTLILVSLFSRTQMEGSGNWICPSLIQYVVFFTDTLALITEDHSLSTFKKEFQLLLLTWDLRLYLDLAKICATHTQHCHCIPYSRCHCSLFPWNSVIIALSPNSLNKEGELNPQPTKLLPPCVFGEVSVWNPVFTLTSETTVLTEAALNQLSVSLLAKTPVWATVWPLVCVSLTFIVTQAQPY